MNKTLCIWLVIALNINKVLGADKITQGDSLNQSTNLLRPIVDVDKYPWTILMPTNRNQGRFAENFRIRVESQSERLHPFNTMFNLLAERNQIELDEKIASIGKSMLLRSTEQAIRESLKDIPFDNLVADYESFFSRLFRNSIANTAEQDFRAAEIRYFRDEKSSWEDASGWNEWRNTNKVSFWKRFNSTVKPRYGFRPDYVYAAFTVVQYKKPILFGDIRFRYGDVFMGNIEGSRFESLLSFPLGRNIFASGGVVQVINPPEWTRRWSFKIVQQFENGQRLFLGLSLRQSIDNERSRITCAYEMPW